MHLSMLNPRGGGGGGQAWGRDFDIFFKKANFPSRGKIIGENPYPGRVGKGKVVNYPLNLVALDYILSKSLPWGCHVRSKSLPWGQTL